LWWGWVFCSEESFVVGEDDDGGAVAIGVVAIS
jgi:hypothetical protein